MRSTRAQAPSDIGCHDICLIYFVTISTKDCNEIDMTLTGSQLSVWPTQPYFTHRIEGARQVEQLNEFGGLGIRFQSLPGSLEIAGAQNERFSLWRTRASEGFRTIPQIAADLLSIRFITQGALLRRNPRESFIAQPSRAILVDFAEMREEQASRVFESVGGTISRKALAAGYLALEGQKTVGDLRFEPVVDVNSLPMRALMQTFGSLNDRLKGGLLSNDILFPLLEEIMVYQLLSAWPRRIFAASGAAQKGTSRHVRTAIDYIDAHIAERILLADIAKAAGINVRALQLAFRTELGTTPVAYIIDLRLDRVYADLAIRTDGLPIKTVAGRWGFVHMSDFTVRFQRRFGHLPSQMRDGVDAAVIGPH